MGKLPVAPAYRRLAPHERRRELVEAGFEVFGTTPYEDVVVDDVARIAGVRRGLIYHYFPRGKPELFAAVLEFALALGTAHVDASPERPLDEKLPANLRTFLDLAEHEDQRIYWIYRQALRVDDPEMRARMEDTRMHLVRTIALNHLGTENPPPVVVAALKGWLAFTQSVVEEWRTKGEPDRAQVEQVFASVLVDVVRAAREAS